MAASRLLPNGSLQCSPSTVLLKLRTKAVVRDLLFFTANQPVCIEITNTLKNQVKTLENESVVSLRKLKTQGLPWSK